MPASEQRVITETTTHLDGSLTTGNLRYYFWETSEYFGHFRKLSGHLREWLVTSEDVVTKSEHLETTFEIFRNTLQIPRVNFRYRWCSEKIRRSFKVVLLSSIMRAWFERSRSITKIHSNMLGNGLRGFKYRFVWCETLKEIKKRTRFKWPLERLSERLNMQFCVKNLQHPFFESREA